MATRRSTAILEKDGDLSVALGPELDIASQGATVEDATANLKEAEIQQRLRGHIFVTSVEAAHG